MSLFSDKKTFVRRYMTCASMKTLWDKLIFCAFIQGYCVNIACDYDEARDETDNFSS